LNLGGDVLKRALNRSVTQIKTLTVQPNNKTILSAAVGTAGHQHVLETCSVDGV
jgi:hypothetical protein